MGNKQHKAWTAPSSPTTYFCLPITMIEQFVHLCPEWTEMVACLGSLIRKEHLV
jgi:hypothetical protein